MPLTVIIPKSASATNQTLVPAAAYTASDTAGPFPVGHFSSAGITVAVTTLSGTLDVYVQKLLPDNATYDDIAHFAQWSTAVFTTTGTYTLNFVNGGNLINQQLAVGLAANSIAQAHFGAYWRINYVIAGTGATASFGVFGDFQTVDLGSTNTGSGTGAPSYVRIEDGTTTALAVVSAPADAVVNTTTGLAVVGFGSVFNGTTWDRVRSYNAGASVNAVGNLAAGILGWTDSGGGQSLKIYAGAPNTDTQPSTDYLLKTSAYGHVFNGTTFERVRTANSASGTTGTGLLGVHHLAFDGTNFQRTYNATFALGRNGNNLNAVGSFLYDGTNWQAFESAFSRGDGDNGRSEPAFQPYLFNGTAYDRIRATSLVNFPTSQTLTARNTVGVQITERGSRWSVISNPAAGSQATASIAAEAGVRHVVDSICFSAAATTAPAATALAINVRDGASGAGIAIWTYQVVITNATGQLVAPHSLNGLNLVGTTNTAMTIEFSAALTSLIEAVSISGYNVV